MRKRVFGLLAGILAASTFSSHVEAATVNQTPSLEAYQLNNYAKLEWAVEILEEDVLYRTNFEETDETLRLTYNSTGNRYYGGQSFTTEDKYNGNRSLKIIDSYSNGNYRYTNLFGDVYYSPYSIAIFSERKYLSNGTNLSVSFRAKTDGIGDISPLGIGGSADYGNPLNITFLEDVKIGDRTAKVSNPSFFKSYVDRGFTFYLASEKGKYRSSLVVTSVDMNNSTITVSDSFLGEFKSGDKVLQHLWINPVNFPSRQVKKENGWTLFNVNTKVLNRPDYNTLNRGIQLWIRTTTYNTVYIDDFKMGFATRTQLFRGNTLLYDGYLSDYEDKNATDKAIPNKVSNFTTSRNGEQLFLHITKPNDNGTNYSYTVKAISNKGTSTYTSPIKTVHIKTGIKGYSYVIDRQATTNPNGEIQSTDGVIPVPFTADENSYLHIQAVDFAGNKSEVTHIPLKNMVKQSMSLSVPTIKPFENITLTDQPKTYATSFHGPIKIKNYYQKENEKLRLTVHASPLRLNGSTYSLPKGSLHLLPFTDTKTINGNGVLPVNRMTGKKTIDGSTVYVAEGIKTIGEYDISFPTNALELTVDPTTAKKGTYTSTLTWQLTSAP